MAPVDAIPVEPRARHELSNMSVPRAARVRQQSSSVNSTGCMSRTNRYRAVTNRDLYTLRGSPATVHTLEDSLELSLSHEAQRGPGDKSRQGNPNRTLPILTPVGQRPGTSLTCDVSHRWYGRDSHLGVLCVTFRSCPGTLIGYARCSTDIHDLTA
jgi:hypothetical protein